MNDGDRIVAFHRQTVNTVTRIYAPAMVIDAAHGINLIAADVMNE
jgi:hypothetical protein